MQCTSRETSVKMASIVFLPTWGQGREPANDVSRLSFSRVSSACSTALSSGTRAYIRIWFMHVEGSVLLVGTPEAAMS